MALGLQNLETHPVKKEKQGLCGWEDFLGGSLLSLSNTATSALSCHKRHMSNTASDDLVKGAVDYAALYAACGLSAEEHVETYTSSTAAAGGKTKPCTKFFSTSGCPYGESCHFLHFVAGGIAALGMQVPPGVLKQQLTDPSLTVNGYKTRLCNRFNTPEGCRFADNCHFAHGEADLRRPSFACKLPTSVHLFHPPPPPPLPSYNVHAAMLQSADAAYNTMATYNPAQTTAAGDAAPYTTTSAACSFTYPSITTSTHLYTPPSTSAYTATHCFGAEPTPPGVTVAATTSCTPHEAALMTA